MEFKGTASAYNISSLYGNESSYGNATDYVIYLVQNSTARSVNESDTFKPFNLEQMVGPKREPLGSAITMTLVYIVILLTGAVGNICTCIVIARNRYMHTATNYYLFSLAVSDLLLLVLGLPQDLYHIWDRYPYVFGEVFCILRGWTSETSTNASILTITAFTIERYLAICHPLKAHTMSRLSRAVKLIIVIWICAGLSSITMAYQLGIVYMHDSQNRTVLETAQCNIKRELFHSFEINTAVFFLFPASLLLVLYVLIAIQLRRSTEVDGKHNGKVDTAPVNGVREQRERLSSVFSRQVSKGRRKSSCSSRKAVVKMLVAVVVAFFLCWAPFHAQRLMAVYVTEPTEADFRTFAILTNISGITYYVSATINPILYSIMSLKFRHAFRDTLARCLGRGDPGRYRGRAPSQFTSTRRSRGYETTDFTVVSESPQNADVNGQQRHHSIKDQHVRHPSALRGRFERGARRSEDDSEDGVHSSRKKTSSSISNCSLQLVDEDAFNSADIAEYIDQMKDGHS